ncbi:MAG TPA: sodium:proton antiporter, partial [Sedimenticola sp.]|nr:sodium:proton antiporter [Sedimenticola sp.]
MIQRRGKEYLAPWEQAFDRVLSQIEEFTHRQTTGGIVLMLCAVAALVLANSGWSEGYLKLLKVPIGLELGDLS